MNAPKEYEFGIGDVVAGAGFKGAVEEQIGPFSVFVAGAVTPVSLIHSVLSRAAPALPTGGVFG